MHAAHSSRRAGAAAAAAASDMTPINAKKPPKRKTVPVAATTTPCSSSAAGSSSSSSAAAAAATSALRPTPSTAISSHDAPLLGAVEGLPVDWAPPKASAGRQSRPPPVPPAAAGERGANGQLPMLQPQAGIDADEAYGSQEAALSQYLKLHPVLSLESTSCQTLQLVADLVESTSIPTRELEVVPKSHDDAMLRPPNTAIGERACCFGDRCICVWLARWRYGEDTDKAFVGTEFLLPSEQATFRRSGTLPETCGKCLVCSRYVHTFVYRCARADPTFQPSAKIPLQAFGNALGVACGDEVPTHSSVANDSDGYRPEALLFVDETWADTAVARGGMATLLWRPVVRFDSTHYEYVRDPDGRPRIVQRGVGAAQDASEAHFCRPATGPARHPLPANPRTRP